MDDLRRGKLTLPWKGFAEHCDYTEEEFASILAPIPDECRDEEIKGVVLEVAGYYAACIRRGAEKTEELDRVELLAAWAKERAERVDPLARWIAEEAERQDLADISEDYREAGRLALDPKPADTRKQLETIRKNLPPILEVLRTLTPVAHSGLTTRSDKKVDEENLFFDIKTFLDVGSRLLNRAEQAELPQSRPGPRPTSRNEARTQCIVALQKLWVECVGKEPSPSWHPVCDVDTGRFLDFCDAVFGPVDPENNDGLGSAIRRVLKALK